MPVNEAKILLVDDEPKNLVALGAILEGDDRELVMANSGEEALRRLLVDDYAVILLDVLMPGLDGFETAALIRERDRTRDLPIIFLTAAVRGEFSVSKGYALGGVDYLLKPFDPDILRAKVAVFVELFKKNKQLEQQTEQLAETTALLQGVLDGSTEHAIMALDMGGKFVEWNEGATRLYGYSRGRMVGSQTIEVLYAGETKPDAAARLMLRADEEARAEAEAQHRRADGSTFPAWVSMTLRRSQTGQALGYVVIAKDMSEIKQAEAARIELMRETAARIEAEAARKELQQIIDILPEAIFILNNDADVVLTNRQANSLLAAVGSEPRVVPALPEDLVPLACAVATGDARPAERLVLHASGATGSDMPVLAAAASIEAADGTVTGAILTVQDISPIEELERQKDAFLAALAHDLRTPLTVVLGKAQLLERKAQRSVPVEPETFSELAHSIASSAKRASSLVNGLLDNARLQMHAALELKREEVNLQELLADLIRDLSLLSDRHELQLNETSDPICGYWDRDRLGRVFNNLIGNAVKYSPDGGVIRVAVGRDGDAAVIEFGDRGIGIPEEDQARIFDMFYRARNSVERFDGIGIGLFSAKKIIEGHGGTITLRSAEHAGSTFTIRLPLKAGVETAVESGLEAALPK